MQDTLQAIISRIEEILSSNTGTSADAIGSYIVGATIVRDDYDHLIHEYPELEIVAEQAAELETLQGDDAVEALSRLQNAFELLKKRVAS